MKYNKEKVEAAKILFAEIINLNEKLPERMEVKLRVDGGRYSKIEVIFWKQDESGENGELNFADEDRYQIFLTDEEWHKEFENSFAEITAKMQEWKELYCK